MRLYRPCITYGPALLLLSFLLSATSCNPTKKLLPGQFLLDKAEVVNADQTRFPKENYEAFFRQKPNRKFLRKFSFFVWWYNLFDAEKIRQKKTERNIGYDRRNAEKVRRIEKKNLRRTQKGKKPKIPRLKDKESATFLESVRDIGEPAVVLDSLLTSQTTFQLSRYLFSKGYFDNKVSDTIILSRRTKKATVKYILNPGSRYRIRFKTYEMEDEQLGALILSDTSNSLIRVGRSYDADRLQAERQRITDFARNQGYYDFENAYTNFYIDTAYEGNVLSIVVRVSKMSKPYNSVTDSLVQVPHVRYTISNVYVITEPVIGNIRDAQFKDTLHSKKGGLIFLLNKPFAYREFLITDNIDIYKGQYFRKDTAQQTYKQLLGLGIFKNVLVQFVPNPDYLNKLDCFIICSPIIKQSLTAETEGTNTSGNLGIDGSLVYQNRNFFRAGELVELRMQGSIAAQSQLRVQDESNNTLEDIPRTFNTIQIGPELTFSVPRAFFPFSLIPFRKDMSPRTYIKSSLNYQSRPDFRRTITSVDYGFNFRTNNNTLRHDIVPFEIYFVRANLSPTFRNTLNELNDAFLVNSFQDHVTTLSRYALSYFSKENTNTSRKTVHYVRWSIQSSGSILRKLFDATGRKKDSLGRYLIMGIPFAHFLRTDADYRIYIPIRRRSRVVYRVAGGIGKPLINLQGLPYEQSFFSGGPNSVRAWRARTLGPGGYNPGESSARFDKIGDILLEGNFEYRFHIIKSFNGALFVDAGNIWRLQPDPAKPGGEFNIHSFADQIAIGGGMGIRWDLNFFVLRIDLAVPLKDPKLPYGSRWTFDKQPWQFMVVNFGIGYPF
jgi:outer membrane protein assembly factor BamA